MLRVLSAVAKPALFFGGFSMRRITKLLLPPTLAVLLQSLFWSWHAQAASDDYYAGKQITFIVGSAAGGGYDDYVRILAPFLSNHIPGRPNIVVEN